VEDYKKIEPEDLNCEQKLKNNYLLWEEQISSMKAEDK